MTETQGLVVSEAMTYGLPAVVVIGGGAGAAIRHGENGLLVKNDAESMAAAIMRFMSDDELHAQFSVEASRSVRGYSSADMARQVLEVYRQVLDAKLPPSLSPLSTPVERGRG